MTPETPTEETKPHNPAGMSPKQVGTQDGWRLLDVDELESYFQDFPALKQVEMWYRNAWLPGKTGGLVDYTYRTKLTREELRKARGLEPEKPTDRTPAKETIDRLTMALAETEALELQHGAVIDRLTRERDNWRESWKQGSDAVLARERDALQSDLAKAREERDARIQEAEFRNTTALKAAREEIARLKGVLAEWSGKAHGPNGPWDMLHKATAEATTQLQEAEKKGSAARFALSDEIAALNAKLSAANARADKAEMERDEALVFATRRKQELKAELEKAREFREAYTMACIRSNQWRDRCTLLRRQLAESEKLSPDLSLAAYLLNVRAIVDERDAMRIRLAEAKENHRQEVQSYERIVMRAKAEDHREHLSALAALEATRKALKPFSVLKYDGVGGGAIVKPMFTAQVYKDAQAALALSLSPSTALRDLKLKVAEAAWKEGFCPSKTAIPQEQIDAAWLASETKAQILGESTL